MSVPNGTPLSPAPSQIPLPIQSISHLMIGVNSGWLASVGKSGQRRGGERGRNVEKWKVDNGGGGKRKGDTWRAKVDYVGQAVGLGVWRINESEREVT